MTMSATANAVINNRHAAIGASPQLTYAAAVKAAQAGGGAAPAEFTELTPESLLIFCQSRLQEMDKQIAQKMTGQKKLVDLQGAISNAKATLEAANANHGDGVAFNSPEEVDKIVTSLDAAITQANDCGAKDAAETLEKVKAKLIATGEDGIVDPKEVKDMSGMLDDALGASRSGAELSMIELQSLVSKRATMLQLTTGMMNSINEGAKAIAANMGR